ncbi:MAG: hypothetical protein COV75_00415 [Candidatus Omnitrophica bacterium CG11_big_fil_rev_8_21_14_0_20_63_9]|nr:MAG: hypothetical protein COV75_00415 [Candidatus Omnitrophica bacterium CG11_big_fil_rev_8_21_14_0_20_63_9]
MPSIIPSASTTTLLAKVPYLNSTPFFRGLSLSPHMAVTEAAPREVGERAAAGEVAAGLLPLADFLRLEAQFERVGPFGIAVRGRARSVLLFSRKPIRQLEGATIAVTDDTSTSAVLLRLILERRYQIVPASYERRLHSERRRQQASASKERRQDTEADALLLIGDEALRYKRSNVHYPFETDVAFEWWLWQHVPCVFAVWAIRKDVAVGEKKLLETSLSRALGVNQRQLDVIAHEASATFELPAQELQDYLGKFIYRLSRDEEEGISRFRELMHAHHLL